MQAIKLYFLIIHKNQIDSYLLVYALK